MKQAAAAAHQRQMLLLAAAASDSSREFVSRDVRRPTFVCAHTGPDTYLVLSEVPKFSFSTSQSKNRTTAQLFQQQCHQVVGNKKRTAYRSRSKPIRAAAAAAAQQQYGSGGTATATSTEHTCTTRVALSFRTRAAYVRTAIRVHMSIEEFSEVACSSTKLRSIYLFADDRVRCAASHFLRSKTGRSIMYVCPRTAEVIFGL